jgi:hypothetical protein
LPTILQTFEKRETVWIQMIFIKIFHWLLSRKWLNSNGTELAFHYDVTIPPRSRTLTDVLILA